MVTLPKPMTSNSKAEGRFGNRTSATSLRSMFTLVAGEWLADYYTTEDKGWVVTAT